ncbi:MAG: hypothetical protein HYV67_01485 [Candidatus Taylorbacteria bacterium]|nr:hypothetical protein [Candidatus Taylorbacteria bacterium]
MNKMNFLRLVSIASFWLGILMIASLGLLFVFRPNCELCDQVFLTPLDALLAVTLSALPLPVAVIARYLSRT